MTILIFGVVDDVKVCRSRRFSAVQEVDDYNQALFTVSPEIYRKRRHGRQQRRRRRRHVAES